MTVAKRKSRSEHVAAEPVREGEVAASTGLRNLNRPVRLRQRVGMWDILKPCQALFNSVIPNNTSEIPRFPL